MNNKSDFLVFAIEDAQATIRAIDVKVAALLVGLLAPLPNVGRIFSHIDMIVQKDPHCLFVVLGIMLIVFWLLALASLVRAISAIDNPRNHIINSSKSTGSFYNGGLFSPKFLDAFLNRDVIKASKDSASFINELPNSKIEIEIELAFEHMKLIYIRDIKMNRLKWGLRLSTAWLGCAICVYVISKYL